MARDTHRDAGHGLHRAAFDTSAGVEICHLPSHSRLRLWKLICLAAKGA